MSLGHPTNPPPSTPPPAMPPPPAPPGYSPPAPPARRLLDLDRPLVAAGAALLATALVLSTLYSRKDGDLDWSNYTVGLLATFGLLAIGALAYVLARSADAATDLVAWPGAFGVVGVGLMIGVAMDDSDATAYVAGLVVLALSVGGVLLTRRGPFVVTAVLGFYVTYLQAMDDLFGVAEEDEVGAIKVAFALALFAVIVTVLGWLLPEARVLAGAVAGGLTVAGFAVLTGALAVAQALQAVLAGFSELGEGPPDVPEADAYHNDAWVILLLALLLVVGWAVCAALTRHVAYRLLMVAMAVAVVPLVTLVLTVEHPSWWGLVIGALGGGLLVAAALRTLQRSRRGPLDAN